MSNEPARETANLQSRLTVKQAAKLMNVSERSIYYARKVQRYGCPELIAKVDAGEMTINKALQISKFEPDVQRMIIEEPGLLKLLMAAVREEQEKDKPRTVKIESPRDLLCAIQTACDCIDAVCHGLEIEHLSHDELEASKDKLLQLAKKLD